MLLSHRAVTRAGGCCPFFHGMEPLESRQLLSGVAVSEMALDNGTAPQTTLSADASPQLQRTAPLYVNTGTQSYFLLKPGCRWEYLRTAGTKRERTVKTVLSTTRLVDGVVTRVLKEAHYTKTGSKPEQLEVVGEAYVAINTKTGDMVAFGQKASYLVAGKWVTQTWLAGKNGATRGVFLPGKPKVGNDFTKFLAPGEINAHGLVVSIRETVTTPAGTFKNCLKIKNYDPTDPGTVYFTYFAPGVGEVAGNSDKLTSFTRA